MDEQVDKKRRAKNPTMAEDIMYGQLTTQYRSRAHNLFSICVDCGLIFLMPISEIENDK